MLYKEIRRSAAVHLLRFWVRMRSLRRDDNSSRGVLPIVVSRWVLSKNPKNEEAVARVGPQCHRNEKHKEIIVS